jgi:sugar phosphate permease
VCTLPHLRTHHLIDSSIVAAETKRDEGVGRVYIDHNVHILWGVKSVAFTPSLPLLVLPAVLFGVAQGINLPNVFSLLNAHAPTENRGAFMATNGMSLRAGQTIGPLFMALAAGTLGLTGAYLTAASLALLLILALVR